MKINTRKKTLKERTILLLIELHLNVWPNEMSCGIVNSNYFLTFEAINFSLVKNLRSFSESAEAVLSFFLQNRSHKKKLFAIFI